MFSKLRHAAVGLALIGMAAVLAACETAPVTGRKQLVLVPESQATELGAQAYRQILTQADTSVPSSYERRVQRIGQRIAQVSGAPELNWEFTVIDDPTPNAFALPGGKVGVHTGLFDVVENDDQLAAVMAHEVAHAVARHGAERLSQQMVVEGGLAALGAATGDAQLVQLATQAATLGVILPYSRTQEREADHIGLMYMARAGYDPRAAVEVWQNFEAMGGAEPPGFLSTHPSAGSRIERLQERMPEAMEVYRQQADRT